MVTAVGRSGHLSYSCGLCEALADSGAKVTLVTSREGEEAPAAGFEVARLLGGMKRTQPRLLRGIDYCLSLPRLRRFLKQSRFDVVHFQDTLLPYADALLLRLLRSEDGPKTVFTAHDPDQDAVNKGGAGRFGLRRRALSRIYRESDRVIVMSSQSYAEMIGPFTLPPTKVVKLPHGNYASHTRQPLPRKQASRSRLGVPPDGKVILFFGALRPNKGVEHLIRAFAMLREREPGAFLVIAGEPLGTDTAPYEQLIRQLGLEGSILFRPDYVPPDLVPTHFVAADVVALPYVRIYQSGVLHLAYTFGRPVVASNIGGLSEDVRAGKSGLLIAPGDEEALAQALGDLLGNPALAGRMGKYAKRLSEENHSWDAIARLTLDVYRTLLNGEMPEGSRDDEGESQVRRPSSRARAG
jgi:glycosyltransferase involved in cell wall biosynthesis